MSDIVESLRWLKQKLKEDAESKGFYQGSAGAETCQEAIDAFESLRQQLATTERLLAETEPLTVIQLFRPASPQPTKGDA